MPFILKSVADARRAAAAQKASNAENHAMVQQQASAASSRVVRDDVRRGHAVRTDEGKWQTTGDYDVGWCRPPEHTRFKKGGPAGPGRPKGAISHDGLLEKHLTKKRSVTIDGERRKMPVREILVMSTIKDAMEGKKPARDYVLGKLDRLFPSLEITGAAPSAREITESDALSLLEFEAEIRREILGAADQQPDNIGEADV